MGLKLSLDFAGFGRAANIRQGCGKEFKRRILYPGPNLIRAVPDHRLKAVVRKRRQMTGH